MQSEEQFFSESRKKIEQYIRNRVSLIKLQMVEKLSRVAAVLFTGIVVAVLCTFVLLFLSIMGGYYFAELTGSLLAGFGIISAIYLLLLILVIIFRKNILEKWVTNTVIRILFEKNEDDDDNEK